MKKIKKLKAVHPGEILNEEFMIPSGISQYRLAKNIGVAITRINQIVLGLRSITVDTAIRFGIYFDTSPEFWLNLQARYDLECVNDSKFKSIKKQITNAPNNQFQA